MILSLKLRYKKVLIFRISNYCFKVPLSHSSAARIHHESQNNQLASLDPISRNHYLPFSVRLGVGFSKYVKCSKSIDSQLLREWLFNEIDTIHTYDSILNVLKREKINQLTELSVTKSELNRIYKILAGIKIPTSSEHGDLQPTNILVNDDESNFVVIDFTSYRSVGSLLFDWLNFEIFLYASDNRLSYEEVLTRMIQIDSIYKRLEAMSLPYKKILFAYVIRRTINEMDEWRINGVGIIPVRLMCRYKNIIENSLKCFEE